MGNQKKGQRGGSKVKSESERELRNGVRSREKEGGGREAYPFVRATPFCFRLSGLKSSFSIVPSPFLLATILMAATFLRRGFALILR